MIRSLWSLDVLLVVMAMAGAVAVAVGVFMWSVPAGLVVAGIEAVMFAYVVRYLEVQSEGS